MLKFFKKQKTENRASYTDTLISAILNRAAGSPVDYTSSSAVEAGAGIIGRGFAGAKVSGKRSGVLSPQLLMILGRDLIRRGESVFLIDASDNLKLLPIYTYNISGNHDPKTWIYEITLSGPSESSTRKGIPFDDIVHVKMNSDAARPWRGNSPADSASMVSDLIANVTASLRDETRGPVGSWLPLPGGDTADMANEAKSAKGAMILTESAMTSYEAGGPAPKGDYEQRRFGPSPPDPLVNLLETSHGLMLAAIGISAALFSSKDAASATAAYRAFAHSVMGPLGRLAEAELRDKLEDPELTIDFSDLRAADVSQRAAGLKRMVESGVDVEKALALSGLLAGE